MQEIINVGRRAIKMIKSLKCVESLYAKKKIIVFVNLPYPQDSNCLYQVGNSMRQALLLIGWAGLAKHLVTGILHQHLPRTGITGTTFTHLYMGPRVIQPPILTVEWQILYPLSPSPGNTLIKTIVLSINHLIIYSNKEKVVTAIIKVAISHLSQISIINSTSKDICIFRCDEPRTQYGFCDILAENVYCTLRHGESSDNSRQEERHSIN